MNSPTPMEQDLIDRLGLHTLEGAFAYQGEVLTKPGLGTRRRVLVRAELPDGRPVEWFLKCYGPEGFGTRLGQRLMLGPSIGPAQRERQNIERLHAAGVPTMRVLAWGQQRDLLGPRRSYILVSSVPGASLEKGFTDFIFRHGLDSPAVRAFSHALAGLVARLHQAGLFHRDLYACHVFMDERPEGPELYLIDLARVIRPALRRFRWRIKDLAQLMYSMPPDWVNTQWPTFLAEYVQHCFGGRAPGPGVQVWQRAIQAKVEQIRLHDQHRRRRFRA